MKTKLAKKDGVILTIVKDGTIQLEKRLKVGSKLFGFYIVPGGTAERGETLKNRFLEKLKKNTISPRLNMIF